MYSEQCEMVQVALDRCVNLLDLNGCMSWVWSKQIVYQSLCVEHGNMGYQVSKAKFPIYKVSICSNSTYFRILISYFRILIQFLESKFSFTADGSLF